MSHDKRRVVAVSGIGRVLAPAAAVATLSGFVARSAVRERLSPISPS